MKSIFLFCYWIIGCSVALTAQSSPILCGNDLFSDIVRKNYPELQEGFDETFTSSLNSGIRHNDPLIVNVVVHVVWKEEAENLHDSIILDQIRVLNEDFNRMNADTANLRTLFKPEAGSANIYFELAEIKRVQTGVEFEIDVLGTNLLSEVKSTFAGGSTAVDPQQNINIWICKIQPITIFGLEVGQILRFAFPPNNLAHWPEDSGAPTPGEDGVVIDYRVFGSNNPNTMEIPGGGGQLVVKGRTPVHEMGHYFGLRHIWGDGGLLGPNDCAQSDGIFDTPYADSQSPFDCDINRNTCSQVEDHYNTDVPDLIENYMDYSSESCMNMFTHGQAGLMRNVLTGPRSGLLLPFSSVDPENYISDLLIKPNPASGPFTLAIDTKEDFQARIRIVNIHGQILYQVTRAKFHAGTNQLVIDEPVLSEEMYFLEIRNEKGGYVEKLIVH